MTASITGWGIQYERPVSRDSARKLCLWAQQPVPTLNMQVTLVLHSAIVAGLRRTSTLVLINANGRFVLASSDRERNEWRTVFGVDPVHPCIPVDSTPATGIPSDGQNLGRDCDG